MHTFTGTSLSAIGVELAAERESSRGLSLFEVFVPLIAHRLTLLFVAFGHDTDADVCVRISRSNELVKQQRTGFFSKPDSKRVVQASSVICQFRPGFSKSNRPPEYTQFEITRLTADP